MTTIITVEMVVMSKDTARFPRFTRYGVESPHVLCLLKIRLDKKVSTRVNTGSRNIGI